MEKECGSNGPKCDGEESRRMERRSRDEVEKKKKKILAEFVGGEGGGNVQTQQLGTPCSPEGQAGSQKD